MKRMKQTPYAEIASVNEPHMAVLFQMDTSGSMQGKALEELRAGYEQFLEETKTEKLALKQVDVAIMRFGGDVATVQDFIPLSKAVEMPNLPL